MNDLVVTVVTILMAALAIAVPTVLALRSSQTRQLQRELSQRDIVIAEMRGQMRGLKDTIESFARAFIDRRNHPNE